MAPDSTRSVTIISNNLAGGGTLACVSLGRALSQHYRVQILGSQFGSESWPGLYSSGLDITSFPGGPLPGYVRTIRKMSAAITGDVVIAHQLRLSSFGVALWHKLTTGVTCALYVDDDDIALTMPGRKNRLRNRLRTVTGDLPTRAMYRLRNRADAIFCGSDFFSEKLGGTTVPLGRDSTLYNPDDPARANIRRELGIEDNQTVIGFMGNPRPHVGIEDLVNALDILDDPNCVLVVVPPGICSDYARDLFAKSKATIRVLDNQPSARVPALLSAADLVVVPQRCEQISLGQLPARLVEAMAMAKPLIVTNVAGMPDWLGGHGIIVEERSPQQIATAIAHVRNHPQASMENGRRLRKIFLERLSLSAMAGKLVPTLDELINRNTVRNH